MGIALMNPVNGGLTKTTYSKLVKITGMNYGSLMSAKSRKMAIKCLKGFYIVDENITGAEKEFYLQKFFNKYEVWKKIDPNDFNIEYDKIDYYISNMGRVKSVRNNKEKVLKQFEKKWKRCSYLVFKINGKVIKVHKAVAKYFLDEPEDEKYIVVHLDGNVFNNDCNNLKWMNRKDVKGSLIKSSQGTPVLKIDRETGEVLDCYSSIREASRENYICRGSISDSIKGKNNTSGGFMWAIDEESVLI